MWNYIIAIIIIWECFAIPYYFLTRREQKRIAQDDLTDIHLYLNLMMLRNFQTKSKVQNIERLEELIKKIEKWIKDEGIRR